MGYFICVEPGVKVFVEDLNPEGKKTIFFIHGWPGSHDLFEYQFEELPKMGFRCVGMDCRGFGQSDKPWSGYGYDRLSDDVRAVIDAMQLQDVALLGHSTGGGIAVRYMARHASHGVSKLVLAAAAAPSLVQRPYFPYGLPKEAVLDIIRNTYADRPDMLRGFGDIIFFQYKTERFMDWIFNIGLQAAGWATAAIANTWLNEEALFYDIKTINAPTLIVQGTHDKVVLFPLATALRDGIRSSKLVPFDESGHFLFLDEKDRFNRELAQFAGQ
jgi:non-heme chloroperoxidase